MSNIRSKIAEHDLREQTLRVHNQYLAGIRDIIREQAPEHYASVPRKDKPMFPDLLEKYMIEQGWYCVARSSSGNGMNMARDQGSPLSEYVPLRPEYENYAADLEEIVVMLAADEGKPAEEIVEDIFRPFERAEAAFDTCLNRLSRKRWRLSKGSQIISVQELYDQANAAWQKEYDRKVRKKRK